MRSEQKRAYQREYMRKWSKTDKAKVSRKKWRLASYSTEQGKKKIRDRIDRYRKTPKSRETDRARCRIRRKIDPSFKLRHYLSTRIWFVLKKNRKRESTMKLLGCSLEDFWIYLESKFKTGMTRRNYGSVWHVDHIMPCAIFDLSKPEHQKRCFHFSNLQPLFAEENHRKHDTVLSDQFNLL